MGTAVLSGILDATKNSPGPITRFTACVRSETSIKRLEADLSEHKSRVDLITGENVKAAKEADIVLLAHKPYMLNGVFAAPGMREALKGKLVISILAGVSISQLKTALGGPNESVAASDETCFVRVMPNMGARIRESMSIIAEGSSPLPAHFAEVTSWIFNQIGKVKFLPDAVFEVATVLLGGAYALTTVAVDGMLDGAVAEGIPRATALEMTAQCLLGTAKMLQDGVHPSVLRESISSPRGCTIQALLTLERAGVRSTFADAVVDGTRHAKKMGENQD